MTSLVIYVDKTALVFLSFWLEVNDVNSFGSLLSFVMSSGNTTWVLKTGSENVKLTTEAALPKRIF